MKTETKNQLLRDFSQRLDDLYESNDEVFQSQIMTEFIKSLDSLSEGERQPVGNNEGGESRCPRGRFCSPNMKYGRLHCTICDRTD